MEEVKGVSAFRILFCLSQLSRLESYKVPLIIGLSVGGVLFVLLLAIVIAGVLFLKRRRSEPKEKRATKRK